MVLRLVSGIVASLRRAVGAQPAEPDPDDPWLNLAQVLDAELREIHDLNPLPAGTPVTIEDFHTRVHRLYPAAALCLSGGGIRSASFALGVLQSLARHGLLERFHYLSTVSGGGYIGSWLSAWRLQAGRLAPVLQGLTLRHGPEHEEAPEIQGLRQNSN